jgi:hypothetical protein
LIDFYRLEQFRFYEKVKKTFKCKNGHLNELKEKVEPYSVLYLSDCWENKYNLEEFERRINELSGTEITKADTMTCPDCNENGDMIHSNISYSSFGPIVVISPTYYIPYDLTRESDSPIEIPDKVHIEGKDYHLTAYVRRENGFDMNVMLDGDDVRATPDIKDLLYHYVAVIQDESSGKWYQFDDTDISEVEPTYKYYPLEIDTFPVGNLLFCNRPVPILLFYISDNETDWKGQEGSTESEEEIISLQTDQTKILEKIMEMKVTKMRTELKKAKLDQDGKKLVLASRLADYMIQIKELEQAKEHVDAKVKVNKKMRGAADSNPSGTGVAPESQRATSDIDEEAGGDDDSNPSVTGDALGSVDGQESSTYIETNEITYAVRDSTNDKFRAGRKDSVINDEESFSDADEEGGPGDSGDSDSTKDLLRDASARKRKNKNRTEGKKKKKIRRTRKLDIKDTIVRKWGNLRSRDTSIVAATSSDQAIVPSTSRTIIRYAGNNFPLSNRYNTQHEQFIQDGVQVLTENTDEDQKEEIANLLQQIMQYSDEQRNSICAISALAHPDDLETIVENIRRTKSSKQRNQLK